MAESGERNVRLAIGVDPGRRPRRDRDAIVRVALKDEVGNDE